MEKERVAPEQETNITDSKPELETVETTTQLKPGESIYQKPVTPEYEVPGIHKMYVEVIFQKLLEQSLADKRQVAILRKFYLEHKSADQVNIEIQKQYGTKAGFHPDKIDNIIYPIIQEVKEKFGYDFTSSDVVTTSRKLDKNMAFVKSAVDKKPVNSGVLTQARIDKGGWENHPKESRFKKFLRNFFGGG